MKMIIEINLDNAAFGESDFERSAEADRVIEKYFERNAVLQEANLFDTNGNKVGFVKIED